MESNEPFNRKLGDVASNVVGEYVVALFWKFGLNWSSANTTPALKKPMRTKMNKDTKRDMIKVYHKLR